MGSIWLRDLEQVIRPGCPFPVITVPGWETRSRSTGGYETVNGIVVHHDAGGPSSDGWPSVNYQCFLDEDRPNAALHVARDARIFVMAAGACNTRVTVARCWASRRTTAIGGSSASSRATPGPVSRIRPANKTRRCGWLPVWSTSTGSGSGGVPTT